MFLLNLPLAAATLAITWRHVPESRDATAAGRPDVVGALLITVGLADLSYALIEAPTQGLRPAVVATAVVGGLALVAFPFAEARRRAPMLPLEMFRSRQFSGANATTFAVYAALGGALFLLALQLQQTLHYSALEAGLAMLPVTVIMLLLSSRIGALAQRYGARLPMTLGPLIAAAGLALMARITPGTTYTDAVLPAVLVFGLGLSVTVAPLTATVLAAVDERHVGAAAGANNAVARVAGLLAVAILPLVARIPASGAPGAVGAGFGTAMLVAAALCAAGGLVALVTVRASTPMHPSTQPAVDHGCQDPCTRSREPAETVR